MSQLLIARNPALESSLPFILCLPLEDGELWLKVKETWPRAARVFCYPLGAPPAGPLEVLERVDVVMCRRRGHAIDLILDRAQNRRSQFVYTPYRGRTLLFWQTPKAASAARPGVRIPSGRNRPGRIFYMDTRERYGYTFAAHGVRVERRRLMVGDYAAVIGDRMVAVVERKTMDDFANSLADASINFAMAELATIPLAAVAVEGCYSKLLRHAHTRRGFLPELIARLQVRYPQVQINFLESRKVAEEWTFRFLRIAYANDEGGIVVPQSLWP
jgi:ERCC4 domain